MSKTIDLLGAVYPDVPAVELPVDGGGTALFHDIGDSTVSAGDVIEDKVFYTAAGVRSVGTLSDATTSQHGLMSATDKTRLDNIYDIFGLTVAEIKAKS